MWSSSTTASRHRQNSRQKRGHSAIVYADQDYYSVLGISKNADKAAIKSAYRQKARKFHPDVNKEPGAEDTFKAVSNAYEVLSDDQKRGIYDRYMNLAVATLVHLACMLMLLHVAAPCKQVLAPAPRL